MRPDVRSLFCQIGAYECAIAMWGLYDRGNYWSDSFMPGTASECPARSVVPLMIGDVNMACDEIDKAIAWQKKTTGNHQYPVTAFFTLHEGIVADPTNVPTTSLEGDHVWYAVGRVSVNTAGHLVGDLQLYTVSVNISNTEDAIAKVNKGTVTIDIAPDGETVGYQQKYNGKLVGGIPQITVATKCLGGAC